MRTTLRHENGKATVILWGTVAICLARQRAGADVLATVMLPSLGRKTPLKAWSRVDLPLPFHQAHHLPRPEAAGRPAGVPSAPRRRRSAKLCQ